MRLSNISELNMLKSAKFTNETRKINRLLAMIEEDDIARAGTPYPFMEAKGRNLLRNADFKEGTNYWTNYQYYESNGSASVIREADRFACKVFDRKFRNGGSVGSLNSQLINEYMPTEVEGKVTVSFKAKVINPSDEPHHITKISHCLPGTGTPLIREIFAKEIKLTEEYQEFHFSINSRYNMFEQLEFHTGGQLLNNGDSCTVVFSDIKLEFGDKTDFTIAPEDGGPEPEKSKSKEGLLYEDIDFGKRPARVISSLIVAGIVYEERLPIPIEKETKESLNKIIFYGGE